MPVASPLQSFAHESITVDNTVGGVRLTIANVLAVPQAKAARITIETGQIRWTDDGTAPTTSVGHLSNPTQVIELTHPGGLWNFRAIRTGATSGTIKVTYFR